MTFWSAQTLKKRVLSEGIINPFTETLVERANYPLHVGQQAFVSPIGIALDPQSRTPTDLTQVNCPIPPGQFGFILTQEKICIPFDAIGFISLRAKYKFKGLVNVSGFHVDPGWNDNIIFAVFNAGSETFIVEEGERLFQIWFANLDEEMSDLEHKSTLSGKIGSQIIAGVGDGHVSLFGLSEAVKKVQSDHETLMKESGIIRTTARLMLQAIIVGLLVGGILKFVSFGMSPPSNSIPSAQNDTSSTSIKQVLPNESSNLKKEAPPTDGDDQELTLPDRR